MTKSLLFTVAGAMLAAATPIVATASDSTSAPTTGAPAPAPVEAKTKYCIIETPTGSHARKKTCLTREEWLNRGQDPTKK
ncbi:hypothetical protein U1769_08885 [Sphingomonas sp. ZT3P38]|uniref:hypothetical protein n=1 Tax=Parasphingomonas zepuensis TaxID=3096161 RepID=UPI002FC6D181